MKSDSEVLRLLQHLRKRAENTGTEIRITEKYQRSIFKGQGIK